MQNKAIEKITKEMMEANDPLVTMLEEHLTGICTNDKIAAKILNEEKTLHGVSARLWGMARDRKQGNGAHISDAECCQVAEEYFGITEEDKSAPGARRKQDADVIDILDFL